MLLVKEDRSAKGSFMEQLKQIARQDHFEPIAGLIFGLVLTTLTVVYLGDSVVSRIGFSLGGAAFIVISALTLSGHLRNESRLQGILYATLLTSAGVILLFSSQDAGIGFIIAGLFSALKAYAAK